MYGSVPSTDDGSLLATDLRSDAPSASLAQVVLNNKYVLLVLDWGPLILFYALEGSVEFAWAAGSALILSVVCMFATHARSLVTPNVLSPKVLDLGFAATFVCFTAAGFASSASADLTELWANALMDGALCAIVVAGMLMGQPFILPYAIEAGLPPAFAHDPFHVATLNEECGVWALAFGAMALVSCVAPLYRCAEPGGCLDSEATETYRVLDVAFTYVAQYAILAGMFWNEFYLGPKRRAAQAAWVQRRPDAVAQAQGVPIHPPGAVLAVSAVTGEVVTSGGGSGGGSGGSTFSLRELPSEGADDYEASVRRCAATLAAAFVDDPLILKWRGVGLKHPGAEPDARRLREAECAGLFEGLVRLALPLRHIFEVDGGVAHCVCVPAWPAADGIFSSFPSSFFSFSSFLGGDGHVDVMDAVFSAPNFQRAKVRHPFPPVELIEVDKHLKAALRGREHLYVFLLGCAPAHHGTGRGRCALRAALRVADERGVPSALECMTEKNRAMYERYGFEVVGSVRVDGCDAPWYAMVREPSGGGGQGGASS